MNAITQWFVSGAIHLGVGFVVGWIVFKRPAWADALINKLLAKIGLRKAD